jgi:16S rRNA (uracil1498-N3)-methyltransferase
MADRYYVNCPMTPGTIQITGQEGQHLAKVCRVRPGDVVSLFNGDGNEYPARVTAVTKRTVDLEIESVEPVDRELGYRLEVAAPIPKGDRGQFLVEKLTELGATHYVPLITQRSIIEAGAKHVEKFKAHVIGASKQCGRNLLMKIEMPVDWAIYSGRRNLPTLRLMGAPGGPKFPKRRNADLAIAVGPEGGFTGDEVEIAVQSGWSLVGLGPRTLRIETAALALAVLATAT